MDNGKENGNYNLGLRAKDSGCLGSRADVGLKVFRVYDFSF